MVAYETHLVVGGEIVLLVILAVLIGLWIAERLFRRRDTKIAKLSESSGLLQPGKTSPTDKKPSELRWLPMAFYVIACLGFVAWILIAIYLQSEIPIYYGIPSTIACLASGRVIDLLQDINDEMYRKRMSKQDTEYLHQLVDIEKFKLKRSSQPTSD